MLTTDSISVTRKGRPILHDVSVELRPGELLVAIGTNGAGKSSLLALLAGDLRPTRGQVFLDALRLDTWSFAELARRRAVLHQEPALNFSFLVEEVVQLGRTPFRGLADALENLAVVRQVLALVDASHLAGRRIDQLSGGERQRVQIARTLAQAWGTPGLKTPSYLLLDEPVASLDYGHRDRIMRVIKMLCTRRNMSALVVLHDLDLALRFAHRLILMHSGTAVAYGVPEEVITAATLKRYFGITARLIRTENGEPALVWSGAADARHRT